MKASVVREFGQGFHLEEISVADPLGQEVLVDVKASGLCHSDEIAAQSNIGYPPPMVLGHEVAGIVTAVGPEVRDINVGDHVVACLVQYCGACVYCLSGRVRLCENPSATLRTEEQGHRLTDADGTPLAQGMALGGFAEKALIHENQLARVPKEIPFPQACLLGCGVVTGSGAVINTANVQAGDTVAIIGTGGVGLNAISGAVIAGASKIIAVDVQDDKLATARKFGATHVVNSKAEDAIDAVKSATDGRGAEHVFDFVGAGDVTATGLEMLAPGGGLFLIGVMDPEHSVSITNIGMLTGQKRITGVYMGSTNPKKDIPMIAELYLQGRYNLDDLVSKEISIDQINEGYESLSDPTINRVVITSF